MGFFLFIKSIEASHGAEAQACDCKRVELWVQFPLEDMKHLIISCLCSGVKAMRVIEFYHSTRNAFRIQRKMGNGVFSH